MVSDNSNSNHFRKSVVDKDKIIDFVKWMWKLERSETGITNSIFATLLFFIVIGMCIAFDEEIYILILILVFIAFLCWSITAVSNTEREERKLRLYNELKRK